MAGHDDESEDAQGSEASRTDDRFAELTKGLNAFVSTPGAALGSIAIVVAWAISGPFLHFSNTWQLIIDTLTTIITFIMVFLLQNAQNRDTTALNAKLDEIVRALDGADDAVVDLEDKPASEIDRKKRETATNAH